jgi:hypothetical protein
MNSKIISLDATTSQIELISAYVQKVLTLNDKECQECLDNMQEDEHFCYTCNDAFFGTKEDFRKAHFHNTDTKEVESK